MLHIIGHIVFALGLLRWLTWELKKSFKPKNQGIWLICTILFSILGLLLSELSTSGQGIGNVLMHAVGGGMATACTYHYIKRNLNIQINWRIEVVFVFLFVSGFGVLNELLEFVAELGGYGIFSLDSRDTWRDFVANSTGAFVVLLAVYCSHLFSSKKAKQ